METDYSELRGKEVNFIYPNGVKTIGFVVGAIYKPYGYVA